MKVTGAGGPAVAAGERGTAVVSGSQEELNYRERATLRAVARGHTEITCSSEPDLFIDGLACCDQSTVHQLARLGLIEPTAAGRPGDRVPAQITALGNAALDTAGAPNRAA